ncbi:MAG: hypothetical protein E7413_05530 [Ruminococcaceae bacterium]|nr:hypothetical protein [Oscillospiraceae bacterium]
MMKHIRINPLFFLVVALSWISKNIVMFLVTYSALFIHEAIHLWFLCKKRIPVREITLEPFGISIQTDRKIPENIIVYLSAPIGNLLIAFCFILSYIWLRTPLYPQWILANLSLGFVNLLPVLPLDGGRALLLYLEKHFGKTNAKKRMYQISMILILPLILGIMVLFFITDKSSGIIIILVFLCYLLLSGNRILEYKKLHTNAFRTNKASFRDAIVVEHLGVPWDYPAKKLIKQFRGEKYFVVNVFRNGILLKTVTETQILNRILLSEKNLTISEC